MGEQFFDDLARGLDDGSISRSRALKLTAGAFLGSAYPLVFGVAGRGQEEAEEPL